MTKTIPFYGTCPALGELTLVSQRIAYPYTTARIRASFPAGCINLLALRFYIATDDAAPAAGPPSGRSILAENSQVDYVTGEGEVVTVDHQVEIPDRGSYIKVYAVNADHFEHAVNVQIQIDSNTEDVP